MTPEQIVAAQWYGLAPWTWGWIVAASAVAVAVAAFLRGNLPAHAEDLAPERYRRLRWWVHGAVLLFWAPGLAGDFNLFDDHRYIHWNEQVTTLNASTLRAVLLENPGGNNQELMYFTFQLDWALFGDAYAGWYATNLLLFAGVLLLVEGLARHLLGHRGGALLAVAFFGLSPAVADLLCWMSARCHLLGLLFTLSSLACWLRWRAGRGFGWFFGALLAFALSQYAKPLFLFVPLWLVLLDLWEGRRDRGRMVLDKLPFVALAAAFALKMLRASQAVGRVKREWHGGSLGATLLQDLDHLVEYLRAVLLPYQTGALVPVNPARGWLAVEGVPMVLPLGFAPLASLVVLVAVVATAVAWWRRGWRLPAFALAAGFVSLLAVMNVPPHTTPFAYRYTASAQVVGAVFLAGATLRCMARRSAPAVVGAAVWLAFAASATGANRQAWSSSQAYWTHETSLYPAYGEAHYYAGKAMQHAGRWALAIHHLEQAERYGAAASKLHKRLGDTWFELGDTARAEHYYGLYFRRRPSALTPFYRQRLAELSGD